LEYRDSSERQKKKKRRERRVRKRKRTKDNESSKIYSKTLKLLSANSKTLREQMNRFD